jgi:hypothetical protein
MIQPMATSAIPETDRERDNPNEFTEVERPLLVQLVAMGWDFIQSDLDYPGKTGRTSFGETVLLERLRAAFRRINKDEHGREWLDDLTIDRAVRELLRPEGRGLLELNRASTTPLQTGVRVAVAQGSRSGEEVTLHVIAWEAERVKENEFLAINQFQVLIKGTPYTKRPDVVLFVNGLPLVVVECKGRNVTDPLEEAVGQLLHTRTSANSTTVSAEASRSCSISTRCWSARTTTEPWPAPWTTLATTLPSGKTPARCRTPTCSENWPRKAASCPARRRSWPECCGPRICWI